MRSIRDSRFEIRHPIVLVLLALLSSCHAPEQAHVAPPEPVSLPRVSLLTHEPTLRVRLERDVQRVQCGGGTGQTLMIGLLIADTSGGGTSGTSGGERAFAAPVTIWRDATGFLLRDATGKTVHWALPALHLRATAGQIRVEGKAYPGTLALVPPRKFRKPRKDATGRMTTSFDVINRVPIEQYLPGVLSQELYGSWDARTYRAQAIAARSYALFERSLHADRDYDLEDSTASQVYGGSHASAKAVAAVRATCGRVLVYDGKVLPAFFSSCCGGVAQDAAAAFPDLGQTVDLPPLRGGARGGWCQASDNYRWHVTRSATTLARRLAAWGLANHDPVAHLRGLRAIVVCDASAAGRPGAFRLTDATGRRYTLAAEPFRFACNRTGSGLPSLASDAVLKSSFVKVRMRGGRVYFAGRGFGHGVGMCQWGAQAMAAQGYPAAAILNHYYPGASIVRAW